MCLFIYVYLFKIDLTVPLFLSTGKKEHKPIFYVIYFKMDQTVCLFFHIGKTAHVSIYLCYLFQS